jgi:hypothetical protein
MEELMFYNLKKIAAQKSFNWQIRDIRKTPPVPVIDAPWSIVSLLGKPNAEIPMYMLSMKSFYRRIGKGKIILITDDETLTKHRQQLEHHFPGIRFEMLDEIDPGSCQRGGTWERLVYLIRRSQEEYVIQLDSDTLVTGDNIHEVTECVRRNISFTYADNHWPIKTMAAIAEEAKAETSNYIGDVLERRFTDWPDADTARYVRGSSGFSGFAKNAFSMKALEDFHEQMKRSLGSRWREWGTEQSGSNFMIANAPGAMTLPFPDYTTFPLHDDWKKAKFFHFIGSNRFRDNYFADQGKRIIEELRAAHQTQSPAHLLASRA